MNFYLKLCILFWGLSPILLPAQDQYPLWFHDLDEEDKFSVGRVSNIFQDSEGLTWVGSVDKGLYQFNGRNIKQYSYSRGDTTSISENKINGRFFEDKRKNLWFCTSSSILRYNRTTDNFSRFHIKKQNVKIVDNYTAIHLERDTFLWIRAGTNAIYRFNIHQPNQALSPLATPQYEVFLFPGVGHDGRLEYIFATGGTRRKGIEVIEIHHVQQDSIVLTSNIHFNKNTPNQAALSVSDINYEKEDIIWIASNQGVLQWSLWNSDELKFRNPEMKNSKSITSIDSRYLLVSEFRVGLFLFDKLSGKYTSLNTKLINDQDEDISEVIREVYIDQLRNWWFTLDGEGLVFTHRDKVKMHSIPKAKMFNGSDNYEYSTILQDKEKKIWTSTLYEGIFLLDEKGNVIKHYHPDNPLNSILDKQAYHMLLDSNQNIWVGNQRGVIVKPTKSDQFVQVLDTQGESVPYATYFYQLKSGEILISTFKRGIYRAIKNNEKWALEQLFYYNQDDNFFSAIYEDINRNIYICHKDVELKVFNYTNEGKLVEVTSLPISGSVNGFFENKKENVLFIATSSGLAEVKINDLHSNPKVYGKEAGLINEGINAIVYGIDDHLWLSTNKGISMFNIKEKSFRNYSLSDGAQSIVFYKHAILAHADGSLWFGGNNGITIVNEAALDTIKTPPKIQLTNIKIYNKTPSDLVDLDSETTNINLLKKIRRNYKDNTLTFDFIAIDYSDPKASQLEYKLIGADNDWVTLKKGEIGSIRYPNLSPGSYSLKIRAYNSDGYLLESEKTLEIGITPPWYTRWEAIALYIIIFVSLIYAYYRYRINLVRKEEAFKIEIAEYKQLAAETETAVLRLQMNPHFIFNSMNSISSYIIRKDINTANEYLNRFAKLMRMILEFSAKQFISVSEEINLLERYLQTESMRFDKKFEYAFQLKEGIDTDELLIPTMVLQPFVENAIWHGLSNKHGTGKIIISFWTDENYLKCSIEDNGIGRVASEKLHKNKNHDSKALTITSKRLKLLPPKNGVKALFIIQDLFNNDHAASGTKVLLQFPLY